MTSNTRSYVRRMLGAAALIATVAIGEAASAGSTFYVTNHGRVRIDPVARTASGILRVARTTPDTTQKIGCYVSYSTSTGYRTTCTATDASSPVRTLSCFSTSSAHAAIAAGIGADSHVFFSTDPPVSGGARCQTITVYDSSETIK
jgi:hypothetical protein